MSKVGYARVSTTDQDTTIQVLALEAAGCEEVFHEQISGTTIDRPELKAALKYLRKGDTLVVTRIDRLARSMRDLQNLVHDLQAQGIDLKATEQPIDTSNAAGKAFLDMLGVFAEFETNLRKERQAEGIAKAQSEGRYKGRGPSIVLDIEEVRGMLAAGVPKTEIARRLDISRASLYRALSGLTDKEVPA